ncbi:uncharacterized protein MYCFIDRAFT_176820 [Pseudocercospora fijiensis CIRAD86]|uniref:Uncharacterized protein n=1 Tax=Pseudocercospora fijiensis (strain CIRAD86) TaxID=383855 RepID=M3AVM9_PSEFD|nr:uncharacterized protein MYCFIDRAFT_176820 [Pseudocercospora fijiensis CIRAD86]EME81532.1 hypothetical protein MYCFIDRAFT_176820 [Pseudocercospora fijiensis CIRAD86]
MRQELKNVLMSRRFVPLAMELSNRWRVGRTLSHIQLTMFRLYLTLSSIYFCRNICFAQIITDQVIDYPNPTGLTLEIDDPELAPETGYGSSSSLLIRFDPAPSDFACFNLDDIPADIAAAKTSGSSLNATLSERGTYNSRANYSLISFHQGSPADDKDFKKGVGVSVLQMYDVQNCANESSTPYIWNCGFPDASEAIFNADRVPEFLNQERNIRRKGREMRSSWHRERHALERDIQRIDSITTPVAPPHHNRRSLGPPTNHLIKHQSASFDPAIHQFSLISPQRPR